jgi:hypothetical protein
VRRSPVAGRRARRVRPNGSRQGRQAHCVEQTIDAGKQVISYKVQHDRFGKPEGGGSTFHGFEAKTFDGKMVAGRSRTTVTPQMSFD